jgi:hypothetical protein
LNSKGRRAEWRAALFLWVVVTYDGGGSRQSL